MASSFTQTTRALERQRSARAWLGTVVALGVMAAWATWFTSAHVEDWVVSESARIEVERAAHPLDAPVSGRIVAGDVALGRLVKKGETLLELDSESQKRRLAEEQTRLASVEPQIAALRRVLAAQERVLVVERGVSVATTEEGAAREREAAALARLAAEEAARAGKLYDGGAIAELDLLRARTEVERRTSAKDALGLDVARRREELRTRESRDLALVEELRKDIVDLEGKRAVNVATIEQLEYEIARRKLVAPIDGRIGDAPTLKVGAYLKEGERIASFVPEGKPRLVASFAPGSTLGRVRVGQTARARLEAFPWLEYGSVPATVTAVGAEPRDGKIRVELEVAGAANPRIPLEHGLVGTAEVSVGRATPATLLLRTLGRAITPRTPREEALHETAPP